MLPDSNPFRSRQLLLFVWRAFLVDAPWIRVTVKGGRGFLLDMQGTIHDRKALEKLLSGRPVQTPRA